jgi:hypothetical protein
MHPFLALQLDLHCRAAMNEKLRTPVTPGGQEELCEMWFYTQLHSELTELYYSCLKSPLHGCPAFFGKCICSTHDQGPISLIIPSAYKQVQNIPKTQQKKMSRSHEQPSCGKGK